MKNKVLFIGIFTTLFILLITTIFTLVYWQGRSSSNKTNNAPSQVLKDTYWSRLKLNQVIIIGDYNYPQISFYSDGTVGFYVGCNSISGNYSNENDKLKISNLVTTEIYCEEFSEKESEFIESIQKVKRFELNNDNLMLYDSNGNLLIEAKKTVKGPE